MTTGQRVFVILHLCLAFSLICWVLAGPFMGEYFRYKSQLLMYEAGQPIKLEFASKNPFQSEEDEKRDVEEIEASECGCEEEFIEPNPCQKGY